MASVSKDATLRDFQEFIQLIYGIPDDRLFSLSDLISNLERFTMRSLKGIRKGDKNKLQLNLLVSFSWLMAIGNRLHIDVNEVVINRFPYVCSYCQRSPCACRSAKYQSRKKYISKKIFGVTKINDLQEMFDNIYPKSRRTLSEAGVHLAEETGELSEACHSFQGEHKNSQFLSIKNEMADYVSCLLGVANSAEIPMVTALSKMYKNNCHICHKLPCACNFSYVASYNS